MFSQADLALAEHVVTICAAQHIGLTTIESCTGGLVSALLTSVSGSSSVIHSNIVTYDDGAKMHYTDIPKQLLITHGAVSEQTAQAMAEGGLTTLKNFHQFSHHLALSITGIAGPSGGTEEKPVGTVCFGIATDWLTHSHMQTDVFDGDRMEVRLSAMRHSLHLALQAIKAKAQSASQ